MSLYFSRIFNAFSQSLNVTDAIFRKGIDFNLVLKFMVALLPIVFERRLYVSTRTKSVVISYSLFKMRFLYSSLPSPAYWSFLSAIATQAPVSTNTIIFFALKDAAFFRRDIRHAFEPYL